MGIKTLFEPGKCSLNGITDTYAYCSSIRQGSKITVDEYGFKAAAYSLVTTGRAAMEQEYEPVLETFILDKAFGFVLYNHNDIPIFSGCVNKI